MGSSHRQTGDGFNFEKYRQFENHFLDFGTRSALLGIVSTLGLTLRQRVMSRLVFYSLLFLGLWAGNRVLPEAADGSGGVGPREAVARPYIAVPYDEIERELSRLNR